MTNFAEFRGDISALDGQRIAFSIPGEVTDGFLSQIAMFNLALRQRPAPLNTARIIAYLGCEAETRIPDRWQPHLKDVEIRFVQRTPGQHDYVVQAARRFTEDDPTLDYVILCDADTLVMGNLDKVLSQLAFGFPIAGVIAHYPPPGITGQHWQDLSHRLTGRPLAMPYRYTLHNPAAGSEAPAPQAPFYLNHGFLAFRADALRAFTAPYLKMRKSVEETLETPFFAGQMALALTANALHWTGAALPMRFNFPNDDNATALHAYEAHDIRVLHYLRERSYKRSELFSDPTVFAHFLKQRPEDSNHVVFDAIMQLTQGAYPFS